MTKQKTDKRAYPRNSGVLRRCGDWPAAEQQGGDYGAQTPVFLCLQKDG